MSALLGYVGDLVSNWVAEGLVSECCEAEVITDGKMFWCSLCQATIRAKKKRR